MPFAVFALARYNPIMNLSLKQMKKTGKKALAAVVCVIAAVALSLGSLIDSPEELFQGAPQAAQMAIDVGEDSERSGVKAAEPAQKEKLRDKLRRWFLGQPSFTRGVVLLPLWAVGKTLLTLLSLLFATLSPVFQMILGVVFNALLLFVLFVLVLKLLFPNLRLRDLFTKRNIILLTAGSLLLSVTDAVLRRFWEDYRPISIAIKLTIALLVLALLSWRIFGKRTKPAQQSIKTIA